MSAYSDSRSDFASRASTPKVVRGRAFTLIELMVVIALIGLAIALLLPASRGARAPARRAQCINNLKQIGLALATYESTYNALPPAYTVDAAGRPLHSWRTLILPFLEQAPLYQTIDLTKPWDDPANAKARAAQIGAYSCPELNLPAGSTTYLAVVAPGGCFLPTRSRRLTEITDGLGATLIVIEAGRDRAVPWMAATDADEELAMGLGTRSSPNHSGGMNALFADGSTKSLPAKVPAAQRRAMISIAGHDDEVARGGL